ncbi:MAG: energy-coupling factor transporter transmembrane protein EcfT, partial [Deltaproteobacteria bacterium]|nr:energy-coupling factor transporter transmembrane protein EcfT [Deltaproteobacteria bacterium]
MNAAKKSGLFGLDPRTKTGLMLITIVAASSAPDTTYELGLVALIAILAQALKPKDLRRSRRTLSWLLAYLAIYSATILIISHPNNYALTALLAFLGLLHKVFPCAFLGSLIISTTKTSEFLTAAGKLHIPKSFSIPLAIMLRYFPTIIEDWRSIKQAMILRDVSPTFWRILTHPVTTMECIYVPLLMAASKASDELSMAAITRGIENPKPRTCFRPI